MKDPIEKPCSACEGTGKRMVVECENIEEYIREVIHKFPKVEPKFPGAFLNRDGDLLEVYTASSSGFWFSEWVNQTLTLERDQDQKVIGFQIEGFSRLLAEAGWALVRLEAKS